MVELFANSGDPDQTWQWVKRDITGKYCNIDYRQNSQTNNSCRDVQSDHLLVHFMVTIHFFTA